MPTARPLTVEGTTLARLPLRVRPGLHETAISMLSRLAVRNGYSSVNALILAVPNLQHRSRFNMELTVAIAAALNDVDAEELARSSPVRIGANIRFDGTTLLSGRGSVQGRVCVGCLAEDARTGGGPVECRPYLRDWWQVAQIAACPPHRTLLIGECLGCSRRLDMRRLHVRFCPCGFDLLETPVTTLEAVDLTADAYLLSRLGRGRTVPVPLLDDLSFTSAASLMVYLGASLELDTRLPRSWNPGSERPRLASSGLAVLKGGWSAFDEALSRLLARSRKLRTVAGRYGRLQQWLKSEPAEDLDVFRARLIDHAREQKAFAPKEKLFGQAVQGSQWTTMMAASLTIGRQPGPIYRMIHALGLGDQATGGMRNSLITVAAAEHAKVAFETAQTSAEACSYLGITREQLRRYVSLRLLRELCPPGSTATAYYAMSHLIEFADAIVGNAEIVLDVPSELVDLRKAATLFKCELDEIVAALHNGRLRAAAVLHDDDQSRGIRRVLVARSDVIALRMKARPGVVTRPEAARLLRLNRVVLGPLARTCGMHWATGEVPLADVRELRRRFVTPRELLAAHPQHRSIARAARAIEAAGIKPTITGSWVPALYERSDVEAVFGPVPEEPLTFSGEQDIDNAVAA